MGRREIEAVTRRTIQTCDLCDRDLGGMSPDRCDICGREAGYCCSSLRLAYDGRQPGRIDLGFRVCRDCEQADQAGARLAAIRDVVGRADRAVDALVVQWREESAEWRTERGGKGG